MRLDVYLTQTGLAHSRNKAQTGIKEGRVFVNGAAVFRPSAEVGPDDRVEMTGQERFVSRGGYKLEAALQAFPIAVSGRVCADIGASTGGFTDCLLQHGAARVYAVDIGRGQLHQSLANHPKVTVMDGLNARELTPLNFSESLAIIVTDISFISLKLVWEAFSRLADQQTEIIALVKPQFEAGRENVGKNGIVRSPKIHKQVLLSVIQSARDNGLFPQGLAVSPITGGDGNIEFLLWLSKRPCAAFDTAQAIETATARAHKG